MASLVELLPVLASCQFFVICVIISIAEQQIKVMIVKVMMMMMMITMMLNVYCL